VRPSVDIDTPGRLVSRENRASLYLSRCAGVLVSRANCATLYINRKAGFPGFTSFSLILTEIKFGATFLSGTTGKRSLSAPLAW
jgi:hypothetical protein